MIGKEFTNLHCDNGLLRLTCGIQDQRKEREENKETNNKSREVATSREAFTMILTVIEEPFFLYSTKILFTFPMMLVVTAADFPRTRVPCGGRVT